MSGSGGLTNEALKDLNSRIDEMKNKLNEQIEKIPKLKQNMQYDLFKFGVIGFVCIFFAIILIKNTMKSINLYYRSKNYEKLNQKYNSPKDDNEYYSFEDDTNYIKELRRNIHKSSAEHNKALENARREKLSSRSEVINEQTLKNETVEANIDLGSIDKQNDDYTYTKDKTVAKSFWDMLFENKNYNDV